MNRGEFISAIDSIHTVPISRQMVYLLLDGPLHAVDIYRSVLGSANDIKNVREKLVSRGVLIEDAYVTEKGMARKRYTLAEGLDIRWGDDEWTIST